jgi:putative Mn2+ efflux pump MntP
MESIPELLQTACSVGFDSLLAGVAFGPIIPSNRARALFALLFGVCDGLATLIGALSVHRLPEAPSATLYLVGVLLITQGVRHSRKWLVAMPILLGVDNLVVGGTLADVPVFALGSAAMAAIGIVLGTLGHRLAGKIWATEAAV